MKPYFANDQRIDLLCSIAQSWLGTPFVGNAAIKGRGTCCHKLAGNIYIESGFWPEGFNIPDGPMNWGQAHTEDQGLIAPFLDAQPNMLRIENESPIPGDLLGFKVGGCTQHLGILLRDNCFVHCWQGEGVNIKRFDDATFLTRLSRIWRPVE